MSQGAQCFGPRLMDPIIGTEIFSPLFPSLTYSAFEFWRDFLRDCGSSGVAIVEWNNWNCIDGMGNDRIKFSRRNVWYIDFLFRFRRDSRWIFRRRGTLPDRRRRRFMVMEVLQAFGETFQRKVGVAMLNQRHKLSLRALHKEYRIQQSEVSQLCIDCIGQKRRATLNRTK